MKNTTSSANALRFTSTLERSTNKLWGCHFRVPHRMVERLTDGDSRRVVCTLNNSAEYQCAILFYGNGVPVISVNKQLRETLELNFGDEVRVALKRDASKYGLPMPDELKELFRQDKEGQLLFHALTPGRQRTLLYIIGKARKPEKRVADATTIVAHLKANKGSINYKQLNALLKAPHP
jgi:hypothetical protein